MVGLRPLAEALFDNLAQRLYTSSGLPFRLGLASITADEHDGVVAHVLERVCFSARTGRVWTRRGDPL